MAICIGISSCVYTKEGSKIECNIVLVVVVRGSGTTYSWCVKVHQQRRWKNRRPLGPLVKIRPKKMQKQKVTLFSQSTCEREFPKG